MSEEMTIDELKKSDNYRYPVTISVGLAFDAEKYAIKFFNEVTCDATIYLLHNHYNAKELSFTREQVIDLIRLFRSSLQIEDKSLSHPDFTAELK